MNRDPEAWARLGRLLREARERSGAGRSELALRLGVSDKAIQNAENGRVPDRRWPPTLKRIAAGLGWAPGSVDAVLAGKDPTLQAQESDESDLNLSDMTAEALALYPSVVSFGQLCEAAGGSAAFRTSFDEAATRLLHSVPGYVALEARGLRRADLGMAALRAHAEGEPPPLDDVLRAQVAADEADSNRDG